MIVWTKAVLYIDLIKASTKLTCIGVPLPSTENEDEFWHTGDIVLLAKNNSGMEKYMKSGLLFNRKFKLPETVTILLIVALRFSFAQKFLRFLTGGGYGLVWMYQTLLKWGLTLFIAKRRKQQPIEISLPYPKGMMFNRGPVMLKKMKASIHIVAAEQIIFYTITIIKPIKAWFSRRNVFSQIWGSARQGDIWLQFFRQFSIQLFTQGIQKQSPTFVGVIQKEQTRIIVS